MHQTRRSIEIRLEEAVTGAFSGDDGPGATGERPTGQTTFHLALEPTALTRPAEPGLDKRSPSAH